MEEETRRNDDVRRSGRIWQNFEVSLRIPEPVYCPGQYWLMIDEYSTASLTGSGANGKIFFRNGCENQKEEAIFCQENTLFALVSAYPDRCIGCAFRHAHHTSFYKFKNYKELRESESYSLACAYHIYVNDLQDVRPSEDLMEFLRRCCPIAYKAVGKVVSAYGGIRCTPEYALVYPIWGRAKQLSWDRTYDQAGHLCYIAYYDAGNAAYAGFIKTLLSPQERIELFRGNENPHEELLGDVFELTLGLLTVAIRFPGLFDRWGDVETINACINGLEKCFIRYSARESITLITARTPKKRKPAKADPEIEKEVREILKALPSSRFLAVPTSVTLQPTLGVTGNEARGSEETYLDSSSQVVEVPRLVPDEAMDPDGQPDEEEIADTPQDPNSANAVKAKAWDSPNMLFNGSIWVNENTAGGSPDHVFANCRADDQLRQQITLAFDLVKTAIESHPDVLTFSGSSPAPRPQSGERASGSNDNMGVDSVASSGRRPKAKARPRRRELHHPEGMFIVKYDNGRNLSDAVHRKRGDYNFVCGEDISQMGLRSHDAVLECIRTSTSPRDISLPQRGDRRISDEMLINHNLDTKILDIYLHF